MDLKKNTILVSRIEQNDEIDLKYSKDDGNESEKNAEISNGKEIYLGVVETTENYEENPQVPDGGLKILIDAYSKKKANIYEV
jgi:hypothetical protein